MALSWEMVQASRLVPKFGHNIKKHPECLIQCGSVHRSEIQQSLLNSNPSAPQNIKFIFQRQEPNILLLVA